MKDLKLNKQQKEIYNNRKDQNTERFEALKEDLIKSHNFGNICRRLKKWSYDKDKDITLTAPMIQAIKHKDMSIFLAVFNDTMLKKWNRKTEIYANFYLSSSETGKYLGRAKLPVASTDEANESKKVPHILSDKANEYASEHAAILQVSGLEVKADDLEIAVEYKEKQYKRKFSMKQVFKVLDEIDRRFYAFRNDTNLQATPRNLKIALGVEINDRDVKKSA